MYAYNNECAIYLNEIRNPMGRPKSDKPKLTATDRVNKSIKNLVASGGKRLMLRLSPDAYAALKVVMEVQKIQTETQAINQVLIAAAKLPQRSELDK